MSKSLTLNCGGTVDISNHSKRNMQYRAPIHKIQHVFADTVYGVISGSGLTGELVADTSNDDLIRVVSIDKKIGDYNKEIKLGDRFILTKQTNVRFNGVFESVLTPAPFWVIEGIQYYITILEKMQIGGAHVKQFFTANSELTNAELSEDGITLRHNIVEPKQGDNTFGGMPVEDFDKDFVITIELQTDLRQNGVYEINTTNDFHGTYREFRKLPYAEYDGEHRQPNKYNTTWCGINVLTDNGEYWYGQSLHSEDYTADSNGELVMNVDWKRGSDASMVLIHQNYPNMFNEIITLIHRFESLDGDLAYTADRNTISVKGDYSGHIGKSQLNDGEIAIVKDTIQLPPGSDGFYTVKITNDGFELNRLLGEFVETNILNLSLFVPFYFGETFLGNQNYLMSSTEAYIYKETRLPPYLDSTRFPNFYIRNPISNFSPPIKSGVIDLNQHIVANQFKLTHTIFQASHGVDISLINNLAEKGLCVRMDELLQNQGYSSAGILNEKRLAANITIMVEADKRTSMNTRDNFHYDSVGINNTINYEFVYRDGSPISDEDALAVGRITLHFNYDGFSILN